MEAESMVFIEKMTEEGGGYVDTSIFLYSGGRAPRNIVNVRIDRSIDAITDGAFSDCNALEYVELHDGVMTIERAAFHGCCSLKRIVMPNQVFDGQSFRLTVDSIEKEMDIQQWLESVHSKIQYHTMERNKLMKEAARISCGANIEDDNHIPFLIQERVGSNESVSTENSEESLSTENSSPRVVAQDELVDNDCPGICYGKDIYEYFRSKAKEANTDVTPTSTYMKDQPHINASMRSILIDWLIEVNLKWKYVPATLYLTVNIVDRYLSKATVTRSELQLVGVTALFIASKYEEIYPRELDDMVHICADAYTESEVLDVEMQILQTLEYQLTVPTADLFLATYIEMDCPANKNIEQLARFILDGTLLSYKLLRYCPSKLAAAAMLIARNTLGMCPWSGTLAKYAQYCESEVRIVARAVLAEKASMNPELKAVLDKYSRSVYGCVANIDIPSV